MFLDGLEKLFLFCIFYKSDLKLKLYFLMVFLLPHFLVCGQLQENTVFFLYIIFQEFYFGQSLFILLCISLVLCFRKGFILEILLLRLFQKFSYRAFFFIQILETLFNDRNMCSFVNEVGEERENNKRIIIGSSTQPTRWMVDRVYLDC